MGGTHCLPRPQEDEPSAPLRRPRSMSNFSTTGSELRWCGGSLDGLLRDIGPNMNRLDFVESVSVWNCRSINPHQTTAQLAWLIRSCPNLHSFTLQGGSAPILLIQTLGQMHVMVEALQTADRLKHLSISWNDGVDSEMAKCLAAVTARLVRLDLESVDFGDSQALEQWAMLGMSPASCLQSLNLSFCRINDKGFQALATALPGATALRTLRMSHNRLTYQSLPALGKLFEQHPTLAFLHLDSQMLFNLPVTKVTKTEKSENDDLLKPFLKGLRSNKTVRELALGRTGISKKTLAAIFQALVLNNTLQGLDVRTNIAEPIHVANGNPSSALEQRDVLEQNTTLLYLQPADLCKGQQDILNRNHLFRSIMHLNETSPNSRGVWSHWLSHLQKNVGPTAVFCVLLHEAPMWAR